MRLVELVAAPGAGKSALSAALLADRRSGAWIDARLLGREPRRGAGPVLRLPGGATPRRSRWLFAAPSEDRLAAALHALAASHPEFLDLVGACAGPAGPEVDDPTLRLLARRWFVEALSTRALIESVRGSTAASTRALLDEGLLHPTKLDAGAGGDPARRAQYLATVPMPDLVVTIVQDADTIAERLQRRAAERPAQARLAVLARGGTAAFAEEAGRLTDVVTYVTDAARRRGVPVVELEGATPLGELVTAVLGAAIDIPEAPAGTSAP